MKTRAPKKHGSKESGDRSTLSKPRHLCRGAEGLTYELTYKDVVDILETIDHSTFGELHIELGDFRLTVSKKKGNPATLIRPSGNSV